MIYKNDFGSIYNENGLLYRTVYISDTAVTPRGSQEFGCDNQVRSDEFTEKRNQGFLFARKPQNREAKVREPYSDCKSRSKKKG